MLAQESAPEAVVAASASAASSVFSGAIPLSWVRASAEVPFANVGDALSALIVGAIAGRAVEHRHFDNPGERMVGIGTIVQDQRAGLLHLWGSGIDGRVNPITGRQDGYVVPPGVTFTVHAVRGPRTADVLRRAGVRVPPVYGDPAWLLPKILPRARFPEATHELGVITHISELERLDPSSPPLPKFSRYAVAGTDTGRIRLINTMVEPTLEALVAKIGEILSCRRILSSSFHGLIIPMAYGVPALTFGFPGRGFRRVDAADAETIDHRFSDFFQGIGIRHAPVLFAPRDEPIVDWEALLPIIDTEHVSPGWTGEDLFEAFPASKAVRFSDDVWPIPPGFRQGFLF